MFDVVLQGVVFTSSILLATIYGAYGYFYWISVGLVLWTIISIVLNFIFIKPFTSLRKIFSIVTLILTFVFLVSYLSGTTIPKLNFYYQPLSVIVILSYFFLSLFELNKIKKKGEIDLDF